jgi:PAS domain S-box-containing protein
LVLQNIEKAKPQILLLPVDPMTTSAPPNDEVAVNQIKSESFVSPLTIAYSNEPIICMLFSIRNFISRHIAFDIICKPLVHLVWCLFVIIPFLSFADVSKIPLTDEETSWINAKHTVRVRIGNAPPFILTDGEVRGIAIDYLTQIFNYHRIKFSYVPESEVTWPQALKYIEKHDVVDMVPTAKITEERKKHMLFTNEYISAPWVIFTRSEGDFTGSIEDLKGKTVSVEEGFVIQKKLQNNFPEIKLKVVSAQLENYATIPIKDLSSGLVDAYIGNLLSTTYLIQYMGYTNVKVAAPTPFDNHNQAMAMRDDWPELVSIINKTLDAMTPEEHAEIRNRWLSVRYEYGISYTDVLKWILSILTVASLVVGFVLVWNRRLKKEVVLREKIEADLLKSKNRLRSALDATPFPVAFADLNADKILYWSRSALSLFGHTVPTTSRWYQVAYPDPDYRQDVIERWKPFLEIAKTSELPVNTGEYQITCKDGSVKTCEIYANFITDFLIVTFNDITQRKKAENLLFEGSAKLKGALESMSDAVFISDVDGNFVEFNEAFSGFHRLQSKKECLSALADWPSFMVVYSEDGTQLPLDMWVVSKALRGEHGVHEIYKLERRDTGETWFGSYNFAPIYNNEGDITGSVVVANDITEKLQIQAQLNQAQKMEAIGTLAGGIAHDFNNILGAILGYAEMVQDDCPPGSTMRNDIDCVVEASYRAKELVKQILAFSRQTESDEQVLQPALIIKEAIKMLRASLPRTIDIQQDIDPEAGLILADPTQIHQIITNLCTNAFHAMEETGGVLNISLKNKELALADLVSESHVQPGHFVEISVGDTGPGIAPELMDKIFDPFFTTKVVGKGTGMGLSIIHGIAKKAGGFVACKSSPGQGATFLVYLQVHADTTLPEAETTPAELAQTGFERILFIDDEEMLAEMGKTMLERLGYRVTVKTDSIEALTTIQNTPEDFDLVITDQTMPAMTGSDLARRILQIRPELPIILCTGFSNQISEEKARIYGIKGFAMKPVTQKDLAALIRKVLDEEK